MYSIPSDHSALYILCTIVTRYAVHDMWFMAVGRETQKATKN